MFVPCPQCIAIPYTLCIWIFPPLASWFCLSRLYSPFLSALFSVSLGSYSVSVGSYTLFLSALTLFLSPHLLGFPTLQPISLYRNAPFVLHLEKYHPSFALPLSPHPFRSLFPVSRCAPFFFVSCHTYSTVPFHPASSPVLPCHTSSLTVFSYPSLSSLAGWKPNKQKGRPLFMWKEVSLSVCLLKSHTRRHCQYFSSAPWLYPWAVGQP